MVWKNIFSKSENDRGYHSGTSDNQHWNRKSLNFEKKKPKTWNYFCFQLCNKRKSKHQQAYPVYAGDESALLSNSLCNIFESVTVNIHWRNVTISSRVSGIYCHGFKNNCGKWCGFVRTRPERPFYCRVISLSMSRFMPLVVLKGPKG